MTHNLEGILLIYRQVLEGFNQISRMAIDGQHEATDVGRAQLARIEDMCIKGINLMEEYKDVILEFESIVEPSNLNPHFQRMFATNPLTQKFRRGI